MSGQSQHTRPYSRGMFSRLSTWMVLPPSRVIGVAFLLVVFFPSRIMLLLLLLLLRRDSFPNPAPPLRRTASSV